MPVADPKRAKKGNISPSSSYFYILLPIFTNPTFTLTFSSPLWYNPPDDQQGAGRSPPGRRRIRRAGPIPARKGGHRCPSHPQLKMRACFPPTLQLPPTRRPPP